MKNLIIIGARGFGREVYALYNACYGQDDDWNCKGFLDSKSDALVGYCNYPSIIASPQEYIPEENDFFICALGNPIYKKEYVNLLLQKGAIFTNLIHPKARINPNVRIGQGCIICRDTEVSADVVISDFVTITSKTIIGHDAKIGCFSHIGSFCFMGGFSALGEGVTMHPGSQIIPHKIAKDWSTIGAGSIVIRNVSECTTVFGNPARKF